MVSTVVYCSDCSIRVYYSQYLLLAEIIFLRKCFLVSEFSINKY